MDEIYSNIKESYYRNGKKIDVRCNKKKLKGKCNLL